MEKKGQGSIIAVILIILIVLVAVAIVWNIVGSLVREKSREIEVGSFITDLSIKKASVGELGNSKIILARGSQGELDGIKFVFYDEQGKSAVEDRYDILNQLETKEYYFSSFGELGNINKIEVYPIINNNIGIKDEFPAVKELSSYLVLSWGQGDTQPIDGLSFSDNLGISFWVDGDDNQDLINQSYEIETLNKKIKFSYNGNNFESSNELTNNLNHVAVSIGPVSTIYINNEYSGFSYSFDNFESSGQLEIGDIDTLRIFNKSLDNIAVSSLYNSQKSE